MFHPRGVFNAPADMKHCGTLSVAVAVPLTEGSTSGWRRRPGSPAGLSGADATGPPESPPRVQEDLTRGHKRAVSASVRAHTFDSSHSQVHLRSSGPPKHARPL